MANYRSDDIVFRNNPRRALSFQFVVKVKMDLHIGWKVSQLLIVLNYKSNKIPFCCVYLLLPVETETGAFCDILGT